MAIRSLINFYIRSLAALNKSSKTKKINIERQIMDMLQQEKNNTEKATGKGWNEEIFCSDLLFLG